MNGFFNDVRFASKQIKQNKLFSFLFVALLAVGIGANTTIFSIFDSLLLKPLPIRNPQNLYLLQKSVNSKCARILDSTTGSTWNCCVAPNYFNAKPEPIILNRPLADLLFHRDSALGRGVVNGTDGMKPPAEVVVGVVETAKYRSMREQDPPTYYMLLDERNTDFSPLILYVRATGNVSSIVQQVRTVLKLVDSSVPLVEVSTIEQDIENSLWQERLIAILSGFFAAAALLLASIGLYGAMAYSVALRTREFGIRMAVGAQVRHIIQIVFRGIGLPLALGLAGGLGTAAAALRMTQSFVYGVKPLDPWSFAAAVVFMLVGASMAVVIPARRAAKIDPATALRDRMS